MVVLGVYQGNWQRVWDLVQSDPDLHAAFGLHPVYLDDHRPEDLRELGEWLSRLAGHRQLCAVGEIGLDYFIETLDRERQQVLFDAQLQLAAEFNLPALIHVRRSHAAVIATLKRFRLPRAGIIHAFAGSKEEAREYIKLGFKLGLGGAATWPQATDSPDMAPAMYPGQRNSPAHLPAICAALAGIMAISPEQLAAVSTANACELFNW
jgi:TatD DNase family protein